jgi:hypothetical protein
VSNVYIRADLRTPIMCDEWLPIDGVIMAAIARRIKLPPIEVQRNDPAMMRQATAELHAAMPIEQHEMGFWLASWGKGKHIKGSLDLLPVRKRYPLREGAVYGSSKIGKVSVTRGPDKACNLVMRTRHVPMIEWWCRGDADEIRGVLATGVTHLGKKIALGHGEVAQWTVQETDDDCCMWYPQVETSLHVSPSRALPIALPEVEAARRDLLSHSLSRMVLTPPYWEMERAEPCIIPIARVGQ